MKKGLLVGGLVLALCGPAHAGPPDKAPCTAEEAGPMPMCIVLTGHRAETQWFSRREIHTGYGYELLAPWGRLRMHLTPSREWIDRYHGHGVYVDVCACASPGRPSRIRVRLRAERPTPLVFRYVFG